MYEVVNIIGAIFISCFIYTIFYFVKSFVASFRQVDSGETTQTNRIISGEMMNEAMQNKKFGDFTLTPAVVIFKDSDVIPSEGFKSEKLVASDGKLRSRLVVSASAEKLLDIFDEFILLLGETCGVVVEDFRTEGDDHVDHFAYYKDTYIVRSILFDFEEFLLTDGFVGVAIWSETAKAEVQLTSHKIIQVFAEDTCSFENALASFGVKEDPDLRFFFEDFYLLVSTQKGDSAIESLKDRLCIDHSAVHKSDPPEMVN